MKNWLYWSLSALLLAIVVIYFGINFTLIKPERYTIYYQTLQLASGESSMVLLDTVNGKTWMLVDEIWRPINRVGEEKMISGPDPALEKAVMAEEVGKLKKQQEMEIDRLKSQYEERYNLLLQKIDAKPHPATLPSGHSKPKIKHYYPKRPLKSSPSDFNSEEQVPDDGMPPGWVNDK